MSAHTRAPRTSARFAGTVLECCVRSRVTKPTTAFVTHFDARWILTLEIDAADAGLPFAVGVHASFAIHSPVQLLHDPAEECIGKPYSLIVELDEAGRPTWHTLRRSVGE